MKNLTTWLICVTFFLVSANGFAKESSFPNVDEFIIQFEKQLRTKQASFSEPENWQSVEWVKKKLAHMVDVDQFMRNESMSASKKGLNDEETAAFHQQFERFYEEIDQNHTSQMKKLIAEIGWPVISQYGKEAESNAWLLVQHADMDLAFQKSTLQRLEKLLPKNETNPTSFAYLFDRVAASYNDISQRTLQKYGTQGKCKGPGQWEPLPMIEPEKIDERRASVGLPSMAEYFKMVNKLCQ